MKHYCEFNPGIPCDSWINYQISLVELDELRGLCDSNWIEIQHLREYVYLLQKMLRQHNIEVPSEADIRD